MANIKEPREPGAYNKKGTQFLSELKVHSQALLQEVGCVEQADQVSNELVQRVAELWGGQLIYIGQGYEFKATQRDQQIYAEFKVVFKKLCHFPTLLKTGMTHYGKSL